MYSDCIGWMSVATSSRSEKFLPVISAVTFLGFIDTNLLVPVVSLYAAELGAGIGIIGLIVGLYSLTNTPANILWGRLIDRIGFKRPLVACLFGDALSMFLYSVCRLPVHLALVRVLHGITGAAVGPATMSAIAGYSDEDRKGRSMGIYGMSIGTATLVGFGLSALLVSTLGFNAVFLFGAGLSGIGLVLTVLLPGIPHQASTSHEKPLGTSFRQAITLLRRRGLTGAYAAIFAQFFTFGGVVTLLPLYIKNAGMEPFLVGIMLAVFSVVFILVQLPVGKLSDRFGRLGLTALGLFFGAVVMVTITSVASLLLLVAMMILYGASYGMIFPSVSAALVDCTSLEERGLATGIFHALLTAGVAVGAPVVGWIGAAIGIRSGLTVSAGIMVLALVLAVITRRRD